MSDADRIARHLYNNTLPEAQPLMPNIQAQPTPEAAAEEPVNLTELLAETVSSARLLVGEASYPHHYLTDPDAQLRMTICEMYAPAVEFTDNIITQCDKLFRWIKTGEVPNNQKPVTRLGVAK